MATSKKQIEANQRNAQKSTGPTSPEGKAVASRNAIKHGLHACDIILKSPHLNENRADYEQLIDALSDDLKPKGILQEHLVLKIANSLWRYRRVINAETARINRELENAADDIDRGRQFSVFTDTDNLDDETIERVTNNHVGSRSALSDSSRRSLMYYEMRLDRQLTRSFSLLHQLQLSQVAESLPILTSTLKKGNNEPI